MPSNPVTLTLTGPSSSVDPASKLALWFPDTAVRPFNIGIGMDATGSTASVYSIQHTFDYVGNFSSNFVGWNPSSAAGVNWYDNTGITQASGSSVNGNYAFPVAAIRLYIWSTSGAGLPITAHLIQAG
jgi:hypothetical protein